MSSTIRVQGARVHNLKNLSVELPRDRLVVFTGLSGSGKSSLAFDTIYAEGQRRYVESLSAYARQFLGQMDKPDVDFIEGLSPAISIDQKTASRNPRSTVGTITEIHDYLRLLFARIGRAALPELRQAGDAPDAPADRRPGAARGPTATRFLVLATVVEGRKGEYSTLLNDLAGQGFSRVRVDGDGHRARRPRGRSTSRATSSTRSTSSSTGSTVRASNRQRLTESVETALKLTKGAASVPLHRVRGARVSFSEQLACVDCGISFTELAPRDFSFNSPYGACPVCTGLGTRFEVDADLVVPDADAVAQRGRARAVGRRALQVLRAPHRRDRRPRRLRRGHPVEEAAGQGPQARPLRASRTARCRSATATATAGSAPTRPPTAASSTGSSASATRPTATGRASRPSSTCARSSARPAAASASSPRSLAVRVADRNDRRGLAR